MPAKYQQCWECGTCFYGRADAHFCCGACRQRAYRARARRSAADETMPEGKLRDAIGKARTAQEEARATVKRAAAARRSATEIRGCSTDRRSAQAARSVRP